MTLGEKVAGAIPDSAYGYVHEHPRVLYLVTVPLLAFAAFNLVKAAKLHAVAELFVAHHAAEAARAASEALGG